MDYGQWVDALDKSFTLFVQRIGEHLASFLGAILLVAAGWLLARLLRAAIIRLSARLDGVVHSQAKDDLLKRLGVERPASALIGGIVFWLVFLLFFTAATETLGLPVLATWLSGISYYLPRILVAALIVLVGLLAGNLARDAITAAASAAGLAYAELLGRGIYVIVLLVAVVTSVDQMGIESRFLTLTITIIIAALIGGAALAFGLGSRTTVSNIIAAHYLRQTYRVGHTVKIGSTQGRIVEITPTTVILDADDGRVMVPAKDFSEVASVLITKGG
jgi:Mechanosensitive ion channel, conserved TM helix/Mechanosensitive ion channel, beta-domain